MAVPFQTSPTLAVGTPTRLFEDRYYARLLGRTYDVSPDGQRFLMIKDASRPPSSRPDRRGSELVRGVEAKGAHTVMGSGSRQRAGSGLMA